MAEVERTRRSHLEGVAARGDVLEVELGASMNDLLHRARIALHKVVGVLLEIFEEFAVFEQRDLYSLGQAAAPLAVGQCVEEAEVVHYGVGRREGAQEVLFAEGVDAVLHPHGRIVLRERGGRHPDEPHPQRGGALLLLPVRPVVDHPLAVLVRAHRPGATCAATGSPFASPRISPRGRSLRFASLARSG